MRKAEIGLQETQAQIDNLDALVQEFDLVAFRSKLLKRVESKVVDMKMKSERGNEMVDESTDLIDKMIEDHLRNVESDKEDVFLMSLKIYKSHLRDLINRDMYAL